MGDFVEFKSDHEQCGRLVQIKRERGWDGQTRVTLVLENPDGFSGDYLRYATRTEVDAGDCW